MCASVCIYTEISSLTVLTDHMKLMFSKIIRPHSLDSLSIVRYSSESVNN